MNEVLLRTITPDPDVAGVSIEVLELRMVHRAAAELRHGAPVIVSDGAQCYVALAAETAEPAALAEMLALCTAAPVVVLALRRLRSVLGHALDTAATLEGDVALAAAAIGPGHLDTKLLRSLADPTAPQHTAETARMLLTEASVPAGSGAAIKLAKIARLLPAVLIAPATPDRQTALLSVTNAAIEGYPNTLTVGLRQVAEAAVPLDSAPDARVIAFRPLDGGVEHLAILVGHPERDAAPLVRVHSACLTGDLLGSLRCDCGPQLRSALARMSEAGGGALLYLAQEGRGIGLVNKLRAYAIQDRGEDTVDANLSLGWAVDERSFLPAAIILELLGLTRVRLLTNNPAKVAALTAHGIEVVAREPSVTPPNGVNDAYLLAKANRLGHFLG